MHPNFADGALPLQVGVGLTRMAVTPRLRRLFCSGTLCGRGYGGWFSPSTGQKAGRYFHPVAAGCSCTYTPDIKNYPVFRWTVEVRRGVTRPAAAVRQPGAEMNETYGMSTSEGIL